jgi:AraC-like DNA-binding protein
MGENERVAEKGRGAGDWARYWRAADEPLEAMHAHFERHVYHRHSHDTYSLGVTDVGAQSFNCRGAARTSAAGMVMAFNPDDPHDGQATDGDGFTYRMIHIGPELVARVLADAAGRPVGLPLFAEPVLSDPILAARLRDLHGALLGGATTLRRDELLAAVVLAAARQAGARPATPALTAEQAPASARQVARRARELIASRSLDDITAGDLAGFADQSHLSRWFLRYYGVTPGRYQRATAQLST